MLFNQGITSSFGKSNRNHQLIPWKQIPKRCLTPPCWAWKGTHKILVVYYDCSPFSPQGIAISAVQGCPWLHFYPPITGEALHGQLPGGRWILVTPRTRSMEHGIRSDWEVIPQHASGADENCMDPLLIPRDFEELLWKIKYDKYIQKTNIDVFI